MALESSKAIFDAVGYANFYQAVLRLDKINSQVAIETHGTPAFEVPRGRSAAQFTQRVGEFQFSVSFAWTCNLSVFLAIFPIADIPHVISR